MKNITISDVLRKVRNIQIIILHKNDGTKLLSVDELTEDEKSVEFDWFEVTVFRGQKCIEFNL